MDAIVTAGGRPEANEPLYLLTQGQPKAQLDFLGKPMIQWVLDALGNSDQVGSIVVVGLPVFNELPCAKPLIMVEDHGGIIENLHAGVMALVELKPQTQRVLTVSSDIPGITTEMINWLVQHVEESQHDIYYNVLTRQVMEAAFPASRRTYIRLKDMEVCGGDMNAIDVSLFTAEKPVWGRVVEARKSPLKQAALMGYDTLLLLLLRQLSLAEAERKVSRQLGIRGRALVCPFAEIGMDVDKPHQYEQLKAYLSKRP